MTARLSLFLSYDKDKQIFHYSFRVFTLFVQKVSRVHNTGVPICRVNGVLGPKQMEIKLLRVHFLNKIAHPRITVICRIILETNFFLRKILKNKTH